MAVDPNQTAKDILATVTAIDTHMQSIAASAAAASSSFGGMGGGGAGGGGGFGGSGSANAGGPNMPPPAGGSGGGHPSSGLSGGVGGSGSGRLGLATVGAAAGGSAVLNAARGYTSSRMQSAIGQDVLANQFAMQGGNNASLGQINARKGGWTGGLGLGNIPGYSSSDILGASAVLSSQYTPSLDPNSAYQQAKRSNSAEVLRQPGLSATQVFAFGAQTATPSTYNALRLQGVQGTDKYGNGLNAKQIAAGILKQGGSSVNHNVNAVRRALMSGGAIDQGLTSAGITGANRVQVQNELLAQASGNSQYLTNTADKSVKEKADAANNLSLKTNQAFVESIKLFNSAVTKFDNAVGHPAGGVSGAITSAEKRLTGHKGLSASGALTGAATGAAVGSAVPVIGTAFGAVAGGIAGAIFGGSAAGTAGNQNRAAFGNKGGGTGGANGGAASSSGSGSSAAKSTSNTSTGSSGKRVWPVGPGNISQGFNVPPNHHPGVDFPRPAGTPIHSAADGVVLFAGPCTGFGNNFVVVFHPAFNKVTRYGHGSAKYVKVGDKVTAGQTIAAVGTEGESTGNHLHLELANGMAINGNAAQNLDPIPWLGGASTSTTGTPVKTDSVGSSSSSSSSPTSSQGQSGFSTISLDEGLVSTSLEGGAFSGGKLSSSSSSSAGTSSTSSGAASAGTGKVTGTWSKLIPAAGRQYINDIQAAAHATGVNPALISAVINTESDWVNTPTSGDGLSSGLMQFISSTGQAYGLNNLADNMNPSKDIMAGAKYLKNLLGQSGGNVSKALAGYNSGNVNNADPHYVNTALPTFEKYGDGGGLGSYAKGSWELERDEVAKVHKGEMIVPKGPAAQLRAGAKGGGNNVTIHVHLANASNAEAMRLVGIVKQQTEKDTLVSALANS